MTFIEPSWVYRPYVPVPSRPVQHHPIKDFSAMPLGDLADRIAVRWTSATWRGEHRSYFSVCVESSGQTHEIGRYDGGWHWCLGSDFVPFSGLRPGVVESDAHALCLNFFRHSGEFCANQALTDFWKVRDLPWWRDALDQLNPLFPIASVLFE